MQNITHGQEVVNVEGKNLRQLIDELELKYPGMKQALMNGGNLKPDVAVAVDGHTSKLGLLQAVTEKSEVYFVPALSGG